MTNSTKIKVLEYSIAVVFILLLLTSLFNLPPSKYFISIYCKLFNTDRYSPMLITMLLSSVYAIPIYFIKKKLNSKQDK